MSGDRGVSLPVAALSAAALMLSAVILGDHAFDLLRLSETDAVKQRQFNKPPVEARLWDDPLGAVVRYRGKLKEICPTEAAKGAGELDLRCVKAGVEPASLPEEAIGDPLTLTVIAALVPGASFMGVEETRRRMRYALLAGLAAERLVPDSSELMGLLRVPLCGPLQACEAAVAEQKPSIDVPYETFSTELDSNSATNKGRRVAVLWINDFAIASGGNPWLSTLAALLATVAPQNGIRFRILGPQTSDKLIEALDDLAAVEAPPAIGPPTRNWQILTSLEVISPFATAPDGILLKDEERAEICNGRDDCLDTAFKRRLKLTRTARYFVRTVSPDEKQVKLLLKELCLRGLGDGKGGRIILLREWDSVYARSIERTLGPTLECGTEGSKARFEVYSYLRGLDGATPDGASRHQRLVPRTGGDKESKEPEIEWPEARDQRDYVRRLVTRLQAEAEGENRVRAVGIIGVDVHDKLVLAQALRPAFPERMLFTTDLDARLLHPEVIKYTRNLVVASSLPLSPSDLSPPIPAPGPKSRPPLTGEAPHDVKVPPFRDIYQTATFIGARYASAAYDPTPSEGEQDNDRRERIVRQLNKERLYEIGKHGAVELGVGQRPHGDPLPEEWHKRRSYALLSLMVLGGLAMLIAFGWPAPAMKDAVAGSRPFRLSTAILSCVTVATWGFALGVVAELGAPGQVGLYRSVFLALTSVTLFWVTVYPGPNPGQVRIRRGTARRWVFWHRVFRTAAILLAAGIAWSFLPQPSLSDEREPFALLGGVSGWPSQLLRALAVLLFGWFVDKTWNGSAAATRTIGEKYFSVSTVSRRRSALRIRAFWRHPRWLLQLLGRRIAMVTPIHRRNPRRMLRYVRGRVGKFLLDTSLWLWRPQVAQRRRDKWLTTPGIGSGSTEKRRDGLLDDGGMDGARLWRRYLRLLRNGPRFIRMMLWLVLVYAFVHVEMVIFGGQLPEMPARGLDDRALFLATILLSAVGTIVLMILVSDATVLTWRFIQILNDRRTVYPAATVERFAAELGPELASTATVKIAARVEERGDSGPKPRNSLLDDWIDARLLADHTAAIAPQIFFPLILLGLLIVARSPLFDNWAVAGPVLVVLVTYLLWTVTMATVLNFAAEKARRKMLDGMRKDLLWLEGLGKEYEVLAKRFPSLIKQVEDLRKGAFAPFFEQPLVRAILVPLGGAGGLQLVELLAFTRP